jgi:hypothetical protein
MRYYFSDSDLLDGSLTAWKGFAMKRKRFSVEHSYICDRIAFAHVLRETGLHFCCPEKTLGSCRTAIVGSLSLVQFESANRGIWAISCDC